MNLMHGDCLETMKLTPDGHDQQIAAPDEIQSARTGRRCVMDEDLVSRATRFVRERNRPYVSALQVYFKLSKNMAQALFDELVKRGVIGNEL